MAGTPRFKVYDEAGTYVAATIDASLAAALIGSVGSEGWRVKLDGRIIWREGEEYVNAAESYDSAAELMIQRIRDQHQARRLRYEDSRTEAEQRGLTAL